MKKIVIILLVMALLLSLSACSQTVTLHCDTEGCENTVEVDEKDADESWVVYCKECKNNNLSDK